MHKAWLNIALGGCLALAGCGPAQEDGEMRGQSAQSQALLASNPMAPDGEADNSRQVVLLVRMRLVSIEVPVGQASGSEEIWSYLDEEPVAADGNGVMGRNGFRVGRARRDAWPDLAETLSRLTGRKLKHADIVAIPGRPVPIVLKPDQPGQTIFTSHADWTLSGQDYPAGDSVLSVVFTLDPSDPSRVMLTGMPQIQSTQREAKFVRNEYGLSIVHEPTVYAFSPLTFQLKVPSEDLVVIGPGAASRRPSSAGHHFLVKSKRGMDFETVLVLVPKVFATDVPTP